MMRPAIKADNRLSGGDALFLYLERPGMPLNVAFVSIFDGQISLEHCSEFIQSKLHLIPRYLQRVVTPPFNMGLPSWEYDPFFDIRNHVHAVTLRHGTESELKSIAGRILSKMLDRQRPLWDFTLVQGLKGNRTGIVTRMHHCLADGLAGVALLNVLMDSSPHVTNLSTRRPLHVRKLKPNSLTLLDGLINSSLSVAERALATQMEVLDVVHKLLKADDQAMGDGRRTPAEHNSHERIPSVEDFTRLLAEVSKVTERLPFNIVCHGAQRFSWAEIPFDEIKAVKNAYGATVNDVVLTIMTAAIRRYVELQGVRVSGRLLRIGVPVSVRTKTATNSSDLGNRITFLPVTIPLDIKSPRKLLNAIRERMAFLKNAHIAELVGIAGSLLGTLPMGVQMFASSIVNELPLGLCNFICTNVPGPTQPLYLLGHKLLRCYPYVPIGGDLGLNCAVLTYDGTAFFGFSGNVHAAPKLDSLKTHLLNSFTELKKAARLTVPVQPTSSGKSTIVNQVVATGAAKRIVSSTPSSFPATKSREKEFPIAVAG